MHEKDLIDIPSVWKNIHLKLGTSGKDVLKVALHPRDYTYFHACSQSNNIFIENAKEHAESVNLTYSRTISYNEFQCVAQYYNQYVKGIIGVRETIRDNCGQNSSYIISLISEFAN